MCFSFIYLFRFQRIFCQNSLNRPFESLIRISKILIGSLRLWLINDFQAKTKNPITYAIFNSLSSNSIFVSNSKQPTKLFLSSMFLWFYLHNKKKKISVDPNLFFFQSKIILFFFAGQKPSKTMSIADLLQAAEYIERRERGKQRIFF